MSECHWCKRTDQELRPYGPGLVDAREGIMRDKSKAFSTHGEEFQLRRRNGEWAAYPLWGHWHDMPILTSPSLVALRTGLRELTQRSRT